jgi:DNA-binding response OmpR family regulator
LETENQIYEVLVTDIGLPDGSGWDLIAFARQRWPSLRIGVVTGWEPRAGAGAVGDFILRKPVKVAELLRQVGAPL